MKKAKLTNRILGTFILLLFATSCINYKRDVSIETIKTSKNVTHESRNFDESFNKINVSNAINVVIEQSKNTEVTVITNEDYQNNIKTRVENGTLFISNDPDKTTLSVFGYKSTKIHDAATKKIIIKLPLLNGIEANSASKIENKGTFIGTEIRLNASSASEIKLDLEFEKIDAECSSAAKMELKGMVLDLNANASSASKIEAEKLLANSINAESSSASKISVHPILSLKANASSGGKIEYDNNPKHIEKTTNSGGSINN